MNCPQICNSPVGHLRTKAAELSDDGVLQLSDSFGIVGVDAFQEKVPKEVQKD